METEYFQPPAIASLQATVMPEASQRNPYWEAYRARRRGNIKTIIAMVIGLVGGAFGHDAWYGEAARKKLRELDRATSWYMNSTEEFFASQRRLDKERETQDKEYEARMKRLEEKYSKRGVELDKYYEGSLRNERAAYRKATKAWEDAARQMNQGTFP